jgi:hypothetical protein
MREIENEKEEKSVSERKLKGCLKEKSKIQYTKVEPVKYKRATIEKKKKKKSLGGNLFEF